MWFRLLTNPWFATPPSPPPGDDLYAASCPPPSCANYPHALQPSSFPIYLYLPPRAVWSVFEWLCIPVSIELHLAVAHSLIIWEGSRLAAEEELTLNRSWSFELHAQCGWCCWGRRSFGYFGCSGFLPKVYESCAELSSWLCHPSSSDRWAKAVRWSAHHTSHVESDGLSELPCLLSPCWTDSIPMDHWM